MYLLETSHNETKSMYRLALQSDMVGFHQHGTTASGFRIEDTGIFYKLFKTFAQYSERRKVSEVRRTTSTLRVWVYGAAASPSYVIVTFGQHNLAKSLFQRTISLELGV